MTSTFRVLAVSAACLFLSFTPAEAQVTHRLKGSVRTEAGAPVASASVSGLALAGFRGEPFAGVDKLNAPADAKGDWNMLGIQAGVWLFSTTAPGMLPAVLAEGKKEEALAAQQANLARTLFDMVAKADLKNARAQTGLASASLMLRDGEAAGKFLWIARDLAPKDQRPALAAVIGDLQQVARVQ